MVDFEPVEIRPTWVYNRAGQVVVAKRLYDFLLHAQILLHGGQIKTWVDKSRLSNHIPIFLELDEENGKPRYPFIYNTTWELEGDFIQLVKVNGRYMDLC